MDRLDITPRNEDVTVDVTLEQLSKLLGEQGILDDDEKHPEFFYLAAISLDCYEGDEYAIEDVLMEFIRNAYELDNVSLEDADQIEQLLR